jgi:hypothetical protein
MSRIGDFKYWTLADGQCVRVEDVMLRTGLTYTGASSRLRRYTRPEDVFASKKQQGIPKGSTLKKIKWVSAPSKVCWGIQYESEWEDGILRENGPADRYGQLLGRRELLALAKYRDKLRQEWLDNNNIINKENNND